MPELNSVTSPTITTTTTTASATTAESSPVGAPETPAGPAGAPGVLATPAGAPGAPRAAEVVPGTQDGEAPPAEEELQVVEKWINNIVTNLCQGESENCGRGRTIFQILQDAQDGRASSGFINNVKAFHIPTTFQSNQDNRKLGKKIILQPLTHS